LRQLLLRAADAVRSKLLSLASPQVRDELLRVLATVTNALTSETIKPHDLTEAEHFVRSNAQRGTA
jgi:hypothetical protein